MRSIWHHPRCGWVTPVRAGALALAAVWAPHALAAGLADSDPKHGRHLDRGHYDRVGWIWINGREHRFVAHTRIEVGIAHALRRQGIHAWVRDGCVVVSGRHRRISLSYDGYNFTIFRRGHTTVIRPDRWHRDRFRDGHRSWDRGYDRGHDRRWRRDRDRHHDRRRWRWRRGCDLGVGIRFDTDLGSIRVRAR
ncbi:MAG: hypothetical protein AAGB48_08300 [Planctomycetota bacterium]